MSIVGKIMIKMVWVHNDIIPLSILSSEQ